MTWEKNRHLRHQVVPERNAAQRKLNCLFLFEGRLSPDSIPDLFFPSPPRVISCAPHEHPPDLHDVLPFSHSRPLSLTHPFFHSHLTPLLSAYLQFRLKSPSRQDCAQPSTAQPCAICASPAPLAGVSYISS